MPRRRDAILLLALAYLAFVSLGLPDTVLGVAWPSLRARFALSQAGLGVVLTAGVVGYFVSGLVAPRLVEVCGIGRLLVISTVAVTAGLAGYALAPTWTLFFPAAAVIGVGSGAIDAALNSYAAHHFPVRHLNWLHACWGAGATLGPLLMTAVLAHGLSFRVGYAALASMLGVMSLAFLATRRAWERELAHARGARVSAAAATAASHLAGTERDETSAGTWNALRRRRVWLHIAIFFVYVGVEGGTGQWCFTVMREARHLDVETAGAWTTAYWGSLLAGRVFLGFVVDRLGPDRLLRVSTVAALGGAVVFAATSGFAACVGLLVLGASLAPVYPTLMARTPQRIGAAQASYVVGFQVSAATLGMAVIPGGLGLLAERCGPGVVPSVVAVLAAVLMVLHETLVRLTR